MKKLIKILIAVVLAATLLATISIPAMAKKFDFKNAVEEYDQHIQTLYFKAGESDSFFDYEAENGAVFYSSDESIAVISKGGTIAAKDGGKAYVAVVFPNGAYRMYIIDVQAPKQNNNLTSDYKNEQFQSNIQSAQDAMLDNAKVKKDRFDKDDDKSSFDIMMVVGIVIIICVVLLFSYSFLSILILSKTSMSTKKLPVVRETAATIKTPSAIMNNCPKCGKAFDGGAFCSSCGTSSKSRGKYIVPINGKITAQKFEVLVNEWLSQNPYIYDCKISLNTKQSLLIPFVGYKFFVKNATIEYSVADQPQKRRYGFAFLYKFRLFGPIGYSSEKHVAQWLQKNSGCKVISHTGGRIQHLGSKSGFYAQYYNYVFFEK